MDRAELEAQTKKYFSLLNEKAMKQFDVALAAKRKGKDISMDVECPPTLDLADRTENIIGPKGVAQRYREVFAEYKRDRNKAIFHLFREIIEGKLGNIVDPEKRLEQAVKTALVLVTEGVVVAPLDGVPKVKISSNPDGSKYVDIYFAGPIRAAGGTATVFPLILGDYARQLMGLDRYKPTDDEVERYVEEINIYDEIITRQYKLKDDEVRKIVKGCPVCVNGEPTEEREVVAWRDLHRIPNNRVRGGMCLVVSEGVGLKAMKIMSLAKMLGLNWNWLESIAKISKGAGNESEVKPNFSYLSRIAAGRPIFAYPSRFGGFRLRYGRARNTCIMAKGLHPATMLLLDGFIAVGTQIKIERPGKSAEMFPVDTIDGPIVKLANGEVRRIFTIEQAIEAKDSVKEILFLGDILINVGDFRKTAHPLMPAGYCMEWWNLEFKAAANLEPDSAQILKGKITQSRALELCGKYSLPLHPDFIHYYTGLSTPQAMLIVNAVRNAEKYMDGNELKYMAILDNSEIKEILEKAGIPHKFSGSDIIIEEGAHCFFKTFGGDSTKTPNPQLPVLEMLSEISGLKIRDKAGTFIGCRMGRPEAAKPRKMVGDPMTLFPIGFTGGNTRSINKAADASKIIEAELGFFMNPTTRAIEEQIYSHQTGQRNVAVRKCKKCSKFCLGEKCDRCNSETLGYGTRKFDIEKLLTNACENLKVPLPPLVKGVKGLINADKVPEPLEKGILRARQGLHIFRDGTIRFELLNAPLTHFKPSEIGLSVEKAKELGYVKDQFGNDLTDENQICELFVQDIVVNESAGDFFVKVTQFLDEELQKFYGLDTMYNYTSKDQLIGELFLGLAPHTSAAVLCRLIGYSKGRLNFAHPYFHLAKRRNADGDQDSIMLLTDALLNFSNSYLPSSRGGRMDAPLVFSVQINPLEIDDEVYDVETCREYPLELYEKSLVHADPDLDSIPVIEDRIGKPEQFFGFGYTHETSQFDAGPKFSTYVTFKSMEDKMKAQAFVQNKIRAVDKKDALERVLVSHFLPDIIGNSRAFARQEFRCSKCNTKFRRVPLSGKCSKCGEEKLILTIAQGSIRKYLSIAKDLIKNYGLSAYLGQRIGLIEKEIDSVFVQEKEQQKSLFQFV